MARGTRIENKGKTAWRITAVAIALAITTGSSATSNNGFAAEAVPASPAVTAAEEEAVASVRQMFEEAGFEFPDAEIRFHDDPAACRGFDGFYEKLDDHTATVDVCYDRHDQEAGHIQRARMLWHELGHAYLEPRLDETTRTALLDLLGLETWNGGEWNERGGEYATEILIWAMKNGRYRINTLLQDLDDETLAAGYTLLTGLEAPAR